MNRVIEVLMFIEGDIMSKSKKKLIWTLIVSINIIALFIMWNHYNAQESLYDQQITVNELEKIVENKDGYYIYYFQPDCKGCKKVSPYLIPLGEKQKEGFATVNLVKNKQGWEKFNINKTPTIVYYNSGEEIKRLEGEYSEEKYKEFFESK